jgi:hypothetical protein
MACISFGRAWISLWRMVTLALTRWGDLRLGSLAQSGLVRLVQHWRFNEPLFRMLFAETFSMRELLVAHRGQVGRPVVVDLATFDLAAYEATVRPSMSSDEVGALEFGHRTCAGFVVLALSGLLQQFRADIEASPDDWHKSEPLYQGFSFGQIIIAAANGVRHVDEWEAARVPNERQRASMQVLESALSLEAMSRFGVRDIPAAVLNVLSNGGDFERLATSIFAFAYNLTIKQRAER